jgi:asparagine synthase (glutamine-hydrolysing)
MCGIAGVFHYGDAGRPVDRDLLVAMTRCLRHRGPDGEGFHVDGSLGLGHRRLAIVDPTPTGAQPMVSPSGRSWISYNGEIYNHASFRPMLAARGAAFRGTSDTETLLLALEAWGPQVLAEMAGIFGFAFWDSASRRLILARDPLGVKQVYFCDDGKRIVFASEIKALLLDPSVPREPDHEAVNQFLHFHTPLFERTFFRDIWQVRAGEYLEVDAAGVRARRYWSASGFEPRVETPEQQVTSLRERLRSVVGEQLMSDVPVGSFFSAGIDSSSVVAFALRNGQRLRCFGVHFSGQGVVDERPYQEAAAQAMGVDLDLLTLDGASFPDDLRRLMYHQDQPVIGAAMLPMYHVSRLAASRVKVCLGGQGADEVFGGYARYALVAPRQLMTSLLTGGRPVPEEGSDAVPSGRVASNLREQLFDPRNLARLYRNLRPLQGWKRRYFANFAKVAPRDWRAVFGDSGAFSPETAWQEFGDTLDRSPAPEPYGKVLHWDVQTYLTGLFHQDDRMSMASSLESRVPLADPRLVRFAFRTPPELKLRGGASKWILRQAVADAIPPMVLNRRKVGFDTPAESWMRGLHAEYVRETLLSAAARSRGFWDAAAVERALGDTAHPYWFDIVWKLLAIEVWASVFLDGTPATVDPSGHGGTESLGMTGQ